MFEPSPDLVARFGAERVAARLERERFLAAHERHVTSRIARLGLTLLGLRNRARRECLDIQLVEHPVVVAGLPRAFDGFRLLQISDLHSDVDPELIDHVIRQLGVARFDQAVLTGDYHNEIGQPWDKSVALTLRLVPHLGSNPLAILGNHDFLAKVPLLEAGGIRVLLNESVALERGADRLWICGVDDAHSFPTQDLRAASAGIPEEECRILLSHCPKSTREAADLGYALYLCGHTHGGQICLPGGRAIVRRSNVSDELLAGSWRVGTMAGYTSRGTGSCGVAGRLNCPPEITIHILRCA